MADGIDPEDEARPPEATLTQSAVRTAPPSTGAAADIVFGQRIDRYQIRRQLGEGGMGRVFLARDLFLARSVALKLVRRGGGGEFLDEARRTAQLNHPNIVQVYDCDEYEDGLYLALEYIDGDSLRDRMRAGPIERDDALRYTRAIADALAYAHAHATIHCDLKPSNIMVGSDGRVRVVDFGIARTLGDHHDTGAGTADWMAPEQWAAMPLSDRTDVWSLAIVCTQLLTGAHPLGDTAAGRQALVQDAARAIAPVLPLDVPGPVAELICGSLVRDPASRPSAAAWVRTLDDVLTGRGSAGGAGSPYPGLAAFDEHHAGAFFGRERELDELVQLFRDHPTLPIVGPSGSGKSSFLHAGVIPRLRRRERWTILALRPGADPIGALARAVVHAETCADHRAAIAELRTTLIANPGQLAVRLAALAGTDRVLLAVDQLEEIFTQCDDEVERRLFATMLLTCADDRLGDLRVIFTLRDDFLGRLPSVRTLFVLRKLGLDDLRRTITEPLAGRGHRFDDPTVVDDLLREVGDAELADLPLLQFACRTLWDGRDVEARRLRRATYEEMGGLGGALAQHADHALASLSLEERTIARQVLLQLVAGTTRRSVRRDQLDTSPAVGAVLDRFIEARLLVQRLSDNGVAPVVEIIHESLLQTWVQLARWVDETRDERRLIDELLDATSLWQRRGERDADTWAQLDLVAARRRAEQLGLAIPAQVERFLSAGEARHRRQRRGARIRLGMGLATLVVVIATGFTLGASYLAREHLINNNAGTVDLVLAPFDIIGGAPRPVAIEQLPLMAWQLYAAAPGDPSLPGEPLPANVVTVERSIDEGGKRAIRLRAPGGVAFLRVDLRGRLGEACAPSWIRIQAMPGYARSDVAQRLAFDVPTCQATRVGMIEIPAGPFTYGGSGSPTAAHYGELDYTESEQTIDQPRFAIDRTEVSNGAFAPFARMQAITGYPAPIYSNDDVHRHDGDPDYPVTDIDALQAEAYCRYLGKQLPDDYQWVKAFRGGLFIGGQPNPAPGRLLPWIGTDHAHCANLAGTDDGYRWVAPVGAMPCGASPYGVLNLAGNVQEWLSRASQSRDGNPLRALRGGAADSPPKLEHGTAIFRNHKDPRAFSYSVGLRCVSVE